MRSGSTPRNAAVSRIASREVGIERQPLGREAADGLHHLRRAAARVLVQMQPQSRPEIGHSLDRHQLSVTLGSERPALSESGVRVRRRRRKPAGLKLVASPVRASIDRAWPSRPSARASVVIVSAMARRPRSGHALHRDQLHEVGGVQPAAIARGAGGGQHVVRADGVVAGHLRGPRADEDGAGVHDRARRSRRTRPPGARRRRRWPGPWLRSCDVATMMPPCFHERRRGGTVLRHLQRDLGRDGLGQARAAS